MLGRTADQLYWVARYTERAENMARLLDVSHRMSLMLPPGPAQLSAWASALEVAGNADEYEERYGEVSSSDVIRYLAFDEGHPSSIVSCLRAARENARALRATVTTEMWETLNTTWLDLQDNAVRAVRRLLRLGEGTRAVVPRRHPVDHAAGRQPRVFEARLGDRTRR